MKSDGFNINTCREMISLLDVSFECNFITFKVSGSLLQNFLTSWAKFTLQLSRHMAGSKKFSQASLSAHGGRNLNHLIISCVSHCISHCFNFFLNIVGRRSAWLHLCSSRCIHSMLGRMQVLSTSSAAVSESGPAYRALSSQQQGQAPSEKAASTGSAYLPSA